MTDMTMIQMLQLMVVVVLVFACGCIVAHILGPAIERLRLWLLHRWVLVRLEWRLKLARFRAMTGRIDQPLLDTQPDVHFGMQDQAGHNDQPRSTETDQRSTSAAILARKFVPMPRTSERAPPLARKTLTTPHQFKEKP